MNHVAKLTLPILSFVTVRCLTFYGMWADPTLHSVADLEPKVGQTGPPSLLSFEPLPQDIFVLYSYRRRVSI
jgi:hypothetical protein